MGSVHDKLKQKLAGARQARGWKPKDGDNKIYVLPPESQFVDNLDGVESLAFQYRAHYFRIEGKQGEASRCLNDLGQKCPACAAHRAHSNSPDPGLKELARQVKAADTYMFNILDASDLAKGVQRWGANWTCWTGIMEIAANPQWGYVYDPRNCIIFNVNLTPGAKSRTGHNSYKVTPEPQHMSVLEVLQAREGGIAALDGLAEQAMEAKSPEEIQALLDEMGFPPPVGRPGPTPGPTPTPAAIPRGSAPTPVTVAPTPVPVPVPVPVPQPMPTPAAAPVARPIGFTPPAVASAPAATAVAVAPHYDPGPQYTPKMADEVRPVYIEGKLVPRCFSDYKPTVHRCQPCPVLAPCQMKMLGIA